MKIKNNKHVAYSVRLTKEIITQLDFLCETLPDCPERAELMRQILDQGLELIIEKNNLSEQFEKFKKLKE